MFQVLVQDTSSGFNRDSILTSNLFMELWDSRRSFISGCGYVEIVLFNAQRNRCDDDYYTKIFLQWSSSRLDIGFQRCSASVCSTNDALLLCCFSNRCFCLSLLSICLSLSVCLSVPLSVSVCLSISVCLSLSAKLYLCLSLRLSLSLFLSACLSLHSLCLCLPLYTCLSVSVCLPIFVSLSLSLSAKRPSIHPSIKLSIHQSVNPSS